MREPILYTEQDRKIYEEELRDFLPDQLIDIHTHIWKREFTGQDGENPARTAGWAMKVASENTACK